MRILYAGIGTETNTFAPWPTGIEDFRRAKGITDDRHPDGSLGHDYAVGVAIRDKARALGHDIQQSVVVFAEPSGPTLQSAYESLKQELLTDITEKGPFDVILILMHGAMVSTGCLDCEGDIAEAVRAIAPKAAIGIELDPHTHMTDKMIRNSDVIVISQEYPHIDFEPRGVEMLDICLRKAAGKIRPVPALIDLKMIGFYPTGLSPMREILADIRAAEKRPGIVSVSFVHGFPWGDTPDTGSKMLVYADGDTALAMKTAKELGDEIYGKRHELRFNGPNLDAALTDVVGRNGRVVMADFADNAGGGAPSDNVGVLREMLRRRLDRAVFGCVWDPFLASTCAKAGVGAKFPARIGGKCGASSGDPLDAVVEVMAVEPNHSQTMLGNARKALGLCVWVKIDAVDVVISSVRSQTFHPDAFTGLGLNLDDKRIVVVKSSNHFRAGFEPIADHIVAAATEGALDIKFESIGYQKRRDMNYYPRVDDPLAKAS